MIIPIKANRHRIGNGQVSVMNPMPICFLFVGNDISKHIELDRYGLPVVDDIEFVECTLHILPHWTWPGREGEVTPVFVYTNYPSAELFINGKSQGKRTKDLSVELDSSYTEAAQKSFERQKRYRLMWMDTKYEPGTLKVVAYDKDGNAVAEEEVHTAGKPHHIELTADRDRLKADGKDLSFINVRVVDKNGNLCPDATHKVKFNVRGSGSYRAAANGDPSSLESFQAPQMSLFKGQLTAVVQTEETPGVIVFEASASGVKSAKIELISE